MDAVMLPEHSDNCSDDQCRGECQLPESLRALARKRSCGDPICYQPDHLITGDSDQMKAALSLMRDAFVDLLTEYQRDGDWEKQGEFQHRFFDGYATAKRILGIGSAGQINDDGISP